MQSLCKVDAGAFKILKILIFLLNPHGGLQQFQKLFKTRLPIFHREKARDFESSFSALAPTNLPLSLQVSTSEAGAEQLAYSFRAHLNVGAAVIHDTIPLFESYGVRVLEANIPLAAMSLT